MAQSDWKAFYVNTAVGEQIIWSKENRKNRLNLTIFLIRLKNSLPDV